jgi:hypothetical protein
LEGLRGRREDSSSWNSASEDEEGGGVVLAGLEECGSSWRKAYDSEAADAEADSPSAVCVELGARDSLFLSGSRGVSDAYRRANGLSGGAAAHAALMYCGAGLVCIHSISTHSFPPTPK